MLIDRQGGDPARIRDERDDQSLAVVNDLFQLLDLLGIERPAEAAVSAARFIASQVRSST